MFQPTNGYITHGKEDLHPAIFTALRVSTGRSLTIPGLRLETIEGYEQ